MTAARVPVSDHPTPLERLVDALQTALLTAESVNRSTHELADDSQCLVNVLKHAGRCVRGIGDRERQMTPPNRRECDQ